MTPTGKRDLSRTSDDEIELALTALALAGDSCAGAVKILREQGRGLSVKTIEVIRDRHIDRYLERRKELAPQIEAMLAADLLDNATASTKAIRQLVAKTIDMMEKDQIDDPARTARDLSQVAAQAVDKRLAIQGRPTAIVEHRDVAEIIRALEGLRVVEVVDSTAVEDANDLD